MLGFLRLLVPGSFAMTVAGIPVLPSDNFAHRVWGRVLVGVGFGFFMVGIVGDGIIPWGGRGAASTGCGTRRISAIRETRGPFKSNDFCLSSLESV